MRNLLKHPASFWLPRVEGRYYPDFVARVADGRLFVVEYKGDHLATASKARGTDLLGKLWAGRIGNVFLTVRRVPHGLGPQDQMLGALPGR